MLRKYNDFLFESLILESIVVYSNKFKDILKEILIQNVNNVMINEFLNDTTIIIKNLSEKYINILFEFYNVDEDDIEDFFEKNEINDETILNILKITTITKDEFYNILIKNVDVILDDLTYIM